MNFESIFKLLTLLQFVALGQHSHVQQAKQHIRSDVRSALNFDRYYNGYQQRLPPPPPHHHHHHNYHHRLYGHRNRWSGRRKSIERHHHFTGWSAWSVCTSSTGGGGHSDQCVKRRERFCRVKRKCGFTKHVEERKCLGGCHTPQTWHVPAHIQQPAPPPPQQQQQLLHTSSSSPQAIIINAGGGTAQTVPPLEHHQPHYTVRMPVLQEVVEYHPSHHHNYQHQPTITESYTPGDSDFYALKTRPRYRKRRKPIFIETDDYDELISEEQDLEEEEHSSELGEIYPNRLRKRPRIGEQPWPPRLQPRQRANKPHGQRNLDPEDSGIEGDLFQYEDFDFERGPAGDGRSTDTQYIDSYEDNDYEEYRNTSNWSTPSREKATPDALIPRHRRLYSKWSRWTKCSPKCTTRRYKKCRVREQCGREVLREIAYCYTEGSFCQQWLQAQVQKSPPYELRPVSAARRLDSTDVQSNSIVGDFIMNGKGYRGPEYTPQKLKCGISATRNGKRHMYNMLKIIGGKAARKGEWPWQVAIFNRFKEAFCGGTLIAPQWVLTAAHCVRKVLYVRIGEHNLDYEDGTELQLRVLKSYKHPNFDKKTVDSDVALLKLPKSVNATNWIGFSCLPHPYQPLPRNVDCTVIGWGKRRNRDVAGTSVLHQAEVPIIPMDNCRSVYYDYTITKNMFCAGHKRGRIDTCAGDSGGPLLCRDKTKPNHPWTIFGITSFGDGCAKRNKFGIYAKVSNYVDWVWSVINCNGNCKMHQRGYGGL